MNEGRCKFENMKGYCKHRQNKHHNHKYGMRCHKRGCPYYEESVVFKKNSETHSQDKNDRDIEVATQLSERPLDGGVVEPPLDYNIRYCERCGLSEDEYGFEFINNCQGESMCEDCAEESNEEWANNGRKVKNEVEN